MCFSKSLSPHIAAKLDGAEITLDQITEPYTDRGLIIELAGGVAVPLNDTATNLDLLTRWRYPTVVVSRHYLGSINHTLLTLEALKSRGVPVAGVLFNGDELPDTERIITTLSGGVQSLGTIPNLEGVNPEMIAKVGENLRETLKQLLL